LVELSMVSGVGQPSAYAIVVLAETVRPTVGQPGVKEHITAELAQLLKDVNAQLPDYEKLQMLVVAPEPWSIENGMLTPTLKIRRSKIEAAVEAQLSNWYATKNPVQWV
jgi:long-chain acyl-CoA synthetase